MRFKKLGAYGSGLRHCSGLAALRTMRQTMRFDNAESGHNTRPNCYRQAHRPVRVRRRLRRRTYTPKTDTIRTKVELGSCPRSVTRPHAKPLCPIHLIAESTPRRKLFRLYISLLCMRRFQERIALRAGTLLTALKVRLHHFSRCRFSPGYYDVYATSTARDFTTGNVFGSSARTRP
jgi:hypothetical protein